MSAGNDLRREDELPAPLARLLDVQACAVVLLATGEEASDAGEIRLVEASALRRLRQAVEESAPGAVEQARKAIDLKESK